MAVLMLVLAARALRPRGDVLAAFVMDESHICGPSTWSGGTPWTVHRGEPFAWGVHRHAVG
jgi:hypothetical protein